MPEDRRLIAARRWLRARGRAWLVLSWIALAVAVFAVFRHGTDAGIAWDETFQLHYGERILAWFRSHYTDERVLHYRNMYLYGGLFDATAAWLSEHSSRGPYETRHLLTAFVALLGVVGSWKLAAIVGGPLAGFLAAIMLGLTPPWLGHGLFNPKDIPFGTGAIWTAYTATRLAMGPLPPRLRDIAYVGLALGIALAVRPGGLILIGFPCAALGLRVIVELVRRRERQGWGPIAALGWNLAWKLALVIVIAYPLMIATWPWARLSPFDRPYQAFRGALHFHWNGLVLFQGTYTPAHELPRTYLPVWFAISLPETYLVALACAIANIIEVARRKAFPPVERMLGVTMVAITAFVPLAVAIVVRAPVYDGQRHFLFIIPSLASLAGIALAAFFRSELWQRALRAAVIVGWVALCILTSVDVVQLHPYEYVYFNRLSGGLKSAAGRYETDYWGVAYKEAFSWVIEHVASVQPGRRTRVATCNVNSDERLTYYLKRWPGVRQRFQIVTGYPRADIFIASTRGNCQEVPGEVLQIVERQGVPLAYVIRTTNN